MQYILKMRGNLHETVYYNPLKDHLEGVLMTTLENPGLMCLAGGEARN